MCAAPDAEGNMSLVRIKSLACERFEARRSCTTCEHRCSLEERGSRMDSEGCCNFWKLRALSSWGGHRNIAKKRKPYIKIKNKEESK